MTFPVTINVQDGAIGAATSNANIHWLVGDCSAGTTNTIYTFGSPSSVKSTLGYGPLVRDIEDVLSKCGGTVKAVKSTASVSSYLTGTIQSGYPSVTVSGTPNDLYELQLKITKAGTVAAKTAFYQLTLDGGQSWTTEDILPASITPTGTGLTIACDGTASFAVGTALVGKAVPKVSTGADITAALSPFSGAMGAGMPKGLLVSVETTSPVTASAIFDSVNAFLTTLKTNYTFCVPFAVVPSGGADVSADSQTEAQIGTAVTEAVGVWNAKANSDKNPVAVAGYRGRRTLSQPLQCFGAPYTNTACQLYTDVVRQPLYVDPGDTTAAGVISGLSALTYDETVRGDQLSSYLICVPIQYPGLPGFYWKKGVLKAAAGSDFRNIYSTRVFYYGYDIVRNACFKYVNKTLPTKTDGTGYLRKDAAITIDTDVNRVLDAAIMQPNGPFGKKGWASGVLFKIDEAYDLLTTETLQGTFSMVPLGIARAISIDMSFARSL